MITGFKLPMEKRKADQISQICRIRIQFSKSRKVNGRQGSRLGTIDTVARSLAEKEGGWKGHCVKGREWSLVCYLFVCS